MSFPDIIADVRSRVPDLRGRLLANQSLAELTWFRVGGPAQVLFMPEDENDLAHLLSRLPAEIPVTVIGLGSNLIVRDGGVPGVVVRLGRGFNDITIDGLDLRVGAAVPDVKVGRAAQEAGIAGLSFLRGIPGGIGGALRMNGGAYGRETKDALVEARAVDRTGCLHVLSNSDMGFAYRHCSAPDDYMFTEAVFRGEHGDPVGQVEGGLAVGDEHRGPAGHHPVQGGVDLRLDPGVDCGGRVVEQQQPGVGDQRPGEGDPLPLAAGEG